VTKAFYITTPIYYVNDKPHIGHAYTTIACDVLARFKKLDGYQVKFLTGTDEHGQKVAKAAAEQGMTPQELCDKNSKNFRDLAATLGIINDDFIRTTEERHKKACQALWQKLEANGHIYLDKYAGWYSVRDEAFYDEGEIQYIPAKEVSPAPGGPPMLPEKIVHRDGLPSLVVHHIWNVGARYFKIDGSGHREGPYIVHALSSGAPVEWEEEESYFFKLSAFRDNLLKLYDSNPTFIGPKTRFNEIYSFVKGKEGDAQPLRDLSVSRTAFSWGVPVPGNPKHVMYVWIDALTNYITALGYPDKTADMATFWPGMHMVGKDIIRFHCVYWPAFLMAADLPVPTRVYAHGWWTVEGQKMSKSLGNVVDPNDMVAKYGLDQVRYFLMREVPFGNDGDFSEAAIAGRINGELANEFGNLAQRFLSFIGKNLGGVLPEPGELTAEDKAMLRWSAELLERCRAAMEAQAFHDVIEKIWLVVRAANGYVDMQAPWALRKTDPARMNTVLYLLAETVRYLAILMQPFVPAAAAKLLDQLAVPEDQREFKHLTEEFALKGGITLPAPSGVFPRYGDPKVKTS
jgi:methionyl-tRNA synthetase